jgi:SAM-dependent methyltransferase
MAAAWEQTGSPLRPCAEDVAVYWDFARDWIDGRGAPRVLLLGVTPEIYRLPWPVRTDFLAVDRTPAMIATVWPGKPGEVLRAGWLDLPLPPASRDLALCDGGFHLLDHPAGQRKLVERLADVIAPGGRCIFRLFTPGKEHETPEAVLADLQAGRIANLNVLKLRLGMALQRSAADGVSVREMWEILRGLAPSWESLAARLGWSLDHLLAIELYRTSDARYFFTSIEQVAGLFCADDRFVCLGFRHSGYTLGERCPIIVFERR